MNEPGQKGGNLEQLMNESSDEKPQASPDRINTSLKKQSRKIKLTAQKNYIKGFKKRMPSYVPTLNLDLINSSQKEPPLDESLINRNNFTPRRKSDPNDELEIDDSTFNQIDSSQIKIRTPSEDGYNAIETIENPRPSLISHYKQNKQINLFNNKLNNGQYHTLQTKQDQLNEPLIEDDKSYNARFDDNFFDSDDTFVYLSEISSQQSDDPGAEHDAVNNNQTTDNKTSPMNLLATELSELSALQNLKQYDPETQEKLKDPSFQTTVFEIFNMLDKSRHGLICQDGMQPLFEQIDKAYKIIKKESKRGSQIDLEEDYLEDIKEYYKQMFPDNEQFTWTIFYKKLFHLEQNQNIAKHDLIIAKLMIANVESFSEGIYTSFYPKRCCKSCIRLLRKKLRQPSDQAQFEGNEQSIGTIYLLMSIKKSLTKSLRHIPKVSLLYMLRDIAYNQLIVKCKYEKAHGYNSFIIISYLIMFSQFQMRYSTLLFDKYFKNDCGQAIKHDPWSWDFKQICSNLYSRLKFLTSISYFGALRPIVYEIVSILTPLFLLLSYVIPDLSMKQIDDFIKEQILHDIFGITNNNILSFDLHDQVLVSNMIDVPLLLLKLSVLLFDFFDIPELYKGYQRDSEGNFIEANGDIIKNYSIHSPLFTCWFSLIVTLVFAIQNYVVINDSQKILSEGMLDYILNGIMGRLGVVPYIEKIKENFSRQEIDPSKDLRSIDFNQITVQSTFQDISGSSNKIQINLLDSSMNELYQCMKYIKIKYSNRIWAIKPVIFFNEALDDLQLEYVLSVASRFQKFGCLVDIDRINLEKCLQNSIDRNSICNHNQNKRVLFTLDNEPLLKYFIDQELTEQDVKKLKKQPSYIQYFKLKLQDKCLQMLKILLKKHDFDGLAQLNGGRRTLETYAQDTRKFKSEKYIEKYSGALKKQFSELFQQIDDQDDKGGATHRSSFKFKPTISQIKTQNGFVQIKPKFKFQPNLIQSIDEQVELQEQSEDLEQKVLEKQEFQRKVFWFIKELLSGIDLVTDIWILSYLLIYHPAWASISISTILAPFFAAYVPFANYLIRGKRIQSRIFGGKGLKLITVFPIIIFVMAAIDLVFLTCELARPLLIIIVNIVPYLILGAVIFIISTVFIVLYILNLIVVVFAELCCKRCCKCCCKCCCKRCCKSEQHHGYVAILFKQFVELIQSDEFWRIFFKYFQWTLNMNYAQEYYSYINERVFSMDQIDSLFHRSQRVMLQVCLESVPQLFLQAWMLIRLESVNAELQCEEGKLKLQPQQLWFSFLFAIFNLCFVMIEQYGEAQALKIPTLTYTFMCLNGKFGFIPFIASIKNEAFRKKEMIKQPLDFEKIQTTLWGMLYFKFTFKFKDQTCSQFSQSIQQIPQISKSLNEQEIPQINFGNSLEDVDIFEIYTLLESCHQRVKPTVGKIKLDNKAIQDITRSIEVGLKDSNITDFGQYIEMFIEENYDEILKQIVENIDSSFQQPLELPCPQQRPPYLFQLVKNAFLTERIQMDCASWYSLSDKLPKIYKSILSEQEVKDKLEELYQYLKQMDLVSQELLELDSKLAALKNKLQQSEPESYYQLDQLKKEVDKFIYNQFHGIMQSYIPAKLQNEIIDQSEAIYYAQLKYLNSQYDAHMEVLNLADNRNDFEQIKDKMSKLGLKKQDSFKFAQKEVEIWYKEFKKAPSLLEKISLREDAKNSDAFEHYNTWKSHDDVDYDSKMDYQINKLQDKIHKTKKRESLGKDEEKLILKNGFVLKQEQTSHPQNDRHFD